MTVTFPKTRAITIQINALIERLQQGQIKPYPASLERRDLVVAGLSILANESGTLATAKPIGKSAGNDILFKCQVVDGAQDYTFGEKLARILNTVPVKFNTPPQKGFVHKNSSFVYISPNYAEQLLFNAVGLTD